MLDAGSVPDAGGSSSGGAAFGGNSSGGTGTGGVSTGGYSSGGDETGGTNTGGINTGGAGTGGVSTGGYSSGGAGTGGTNTGGINTGGAGTGGLNTGGGNTGGTAGSGGAGGTAGSGGSAAGGIGGTAGAGGSTGGSSGTAGSGGGGALADVAVYIAGDSTVSTYTDTSSPNDQAGWGQMLHEIFTSQVTVSNRATGGRTALWFYLEGAVDSILSSAMPGDYFFIQFGTNDSNQTATFTVDGVEYPRYADPQTDFKTYLRDYYLDPSRAVGVIPVLVTPPPRNSAYCGVGNSLGAHAQAMRELGATESVAVLDLNTKTYDHLAAICPSPTPEDFFFIRSDGTVDGTHFQENGARHMAGFLGECIREIGLGLEPYLLD